MIGFEGSSDMIRDERAKPKHAEENKAIKEMLMRGVQM